MASMNQTHPGLTTQSPGGVKDSDDSESISGNRITYFFIVYYCVVFIAGFVGNIVIIASVIKFKRMRSVVNIFLVNLAVADLMFVLLSIFDAITFLYNGEWIFGDAFCRIQGSLIDLSYTGSVCTLTMVAAERYISICHPHKIRRTIKQAVKVCISVWVFGIVFCACLIYGYSVRLDNDGVTICANDNWSTNSRLSFYTIHSVIVYLVPMVMLCFSHVRISRALIVQRMRTMSSFACSTEHIASPIDANRNTSPTSAATISHLNIQKALKRNAKKAGKRSRVIRLLVVVTVIFFVLWTPFIVVRLLKYFSVEVNELLWRGTQLLIFGNTAVNCFIYALMSPSFRSAFKGIFVCRKSLRGMATNTISRSFDVSETIKRKTSINNPVALRVTTEN